MRYPLGLIRGGAVVIAGLLLTAGCELAQVTVAESEPILIAEVYLRVGPNVSDGLALVYQTQGAERGELEGGAVRILNNRGDVAEFEAGVNPADCTDGRFPLDVQGICYRLFEESAGLVMPGETLRVEVDLPDGGFLDGTTRVPQDFELTRPARHSVPCNVEPGSNLQVEWTQAEGVWAYVPEAQIFGLPDALAPAGINVPTDPVTLLGLAVSDSDTTIAFPGEFGLFNRFSGDRDLLVALQGGFPSTGTVLGSVLVAAQDENATNWLRGGAFNPSGTVRIPSLFGDGTGVVGSVVVRGFNFRVGNPAFPPCDG